MIFSAFYFFISIVFDLNFFLGEYGNGILHWIHFFHFFRFCINNEVQYIIIKLLLFEAHLKYPIYVYVFKPRKHELKADFIMLILVVISYELSYLVCIEMFFVRFYLMCTNLYKKQQQQYATVIKMKTKPF